jgi:hypothetical protein
MPRVEPVKFHIIPLPGASEPALTSATKYKPVWLRVRFRDLADRHRCGTIRLGLVVSLAHSSARSCGGIVGAWLARFGLVSEASFISSTRTTITRGSTLLDPN